MTNRVGRARWGREWAHACAVVAACACLAGTAAGEGAPAQAVPGAALKRQQEYCANIAAATEELRLERRRKLLAELEKQVDEKVQALAARQNELRAALDRLDAFEHKANDALVGFYAGMKPEAAAAQFAQLDDDVAAALMLRLKAKASSLILAEMEAARGAALVKKISDLRNASLGRRP